MYVRKVDLLRCITSMIDTGRFYSISAVAEFNKEVPVIFVAESD